MDARARALYRERMTKTIALCALLAVTACSRWAGGSRTFNRAAMVTAQALLACDYGQTLDASLRGWGTAEDPFMREANPILGPTPSPTEVTVYAASVSTLLVAVYHALPERWRGLAPLATSAVQLYAVAGNAIVAPRPLCGVR